MGTFRAVGQALAIWCLFWTPFIQADVNITTNTELETIFRSLDNSLISWEVKWKIEQKKNAGLSDEKKAKEKAKFFEKTKKEFYGSEKGPFSKHLDAMHTIFEEVRSGGAPAMVEYKGRVIPATDVFYRLSERLANTPMVDSLNYYATKGFTRYPHILAWPSTQKGSIKMLKSTYYYLSKFIAGRYPMLNERIMDVPFNIQSAEMLEKIIKSVSKKKLKENEENDGWPFNQYQLQRALEIINVLEKHGQLNDEEKKLAKQFKAIILKQIEETKKYFGKHRVLKPLSGATKVLTAQEMAELGGNFAGIIYDSMKNNNTCDGTSARGGIQKVINSLYSEKDNSDSKVHVAEICLHGDKDDEAPSFCYKQENAEIVSDVILDEEGYYSWLELRYENENGERVQKLFYQRMQTGYSEIKSRYEQTYLKSTFIGVPSSHTFFDGSVESSVQSIKANPESGIDFIIPIEGGKSVLKITSGRIIGLPVKELKELTIYQLLKLALEQNINGIKDNENRFLYELISRGKDAVKYIAEYVARMQTYIELKKGSPFRNLVDNKDLFHLFFQETINEKHLSSAAMREFYSIDEVNSAVMNYINSNIKKGGIKAEKALKMFVNYEKQSDSPEIAKYIDKELKKENIKKIETLGLAIVFSKPFRAPGLSKLIRKISSNDKAQSNQAIHLASNPILSWFEPIKKFVGPIIVEQVERNFKNLSPEQTDKILTALLEYESSMESLLPLVFSILRKGSTEKSYNSALKFMQKFGFAKHQYQEVLKQNFNPESKFAAQELLALISVSAPNWDGIKGLILARVNKKDPREVYNILKMFVDNGNIPSWLFGHVKWLLDDILNFQFVVNPNPFGIVRSPNQIAFFSLIESFMRSRSEEAARYLTSVFYKSDDEDFVTLLVTAAGHWEEGTQEMLPGFYQLLEQDRISGMNFKYASKNLETLSDFKSPILVEKTLRAAIWWYDNKYRADLGKIIEKQALKVFKTPDAAKSIFIFAASAPGNDSAKLVLNIIQKQFGEKFAEQLVFELIDSKDFKKEDPFIFFYGLIKNSKILSKRVVNKFLKKHYKDKTYINDEVEFWNWLASNGISTKPYISDIEDMVSSYRREDLKKHLKEHPELIVELLSGYFQNSKLGHEYEDMIMFILRLKNPPEDALSMVIKLGIKSSKMKEKGIFNLFKYLLIAVKGSQFKLNSKYVLALQKSVEKLKANKELSERYSAEIKSYERIIDQIIAPDPDVDFNDLRLFKTKPSKEKISQMNMKELVSLYDEVDDSDGSVLTAMLSKAPGQFKYLPLRNVQKQKGGKFLIKYFQEHKEKLIPFLDNFSNMIRYFLGGMGLEDEFIKIISEVYPNLPEEKKKKGLEYIFKLDPNTKRVKKIVWNILKDDKSSIELKNVALEGSGSIDWNQDTQKISLELFNEKKLNKNHTTYALMVSYKGSYDKIKRKIKEAVFGDFDMAEGVFRGLIETQNYSREIFDSINWYFEFELLKDKSNKMKTLVTLQFFLKSSGKEAGELIWNEYQKTKDPSVKMVAQSIIKRNKEFFMKHFGYKD